MNKREFTESVMKLRDSNGCWNVKHYENSGRELTYYVPSNKSTLWTLVMLADIEMDRNDERIRKPLKTISDHFWSEKHGIFTIGSNHFPIPCLNGNMIYLLSYFNAEKNGRIERAVDFFSKYQRFEDGEYITPKDYPYYRNKSCYGKHTCYFGTTKLLKGLSFIPKEDRSKNAEQLIKQCIDFVLLHDVCYSSHRPDEYLHKGISSLTIPNLYKSDFLELLWILKREDIKSDKMNKALELLVSKILPDGTWKLERQVNNLIVPLTKRNLGNELITKRAEEILDYYQMSL